METKDHNTLDEAYKEFARLTNGRVWQLLDKPDRSADENEEMIEAAFASIYHWRHAGTQVHRQRGYWLIAHVYTIIGDAVQALKYARACFDLSLVIRGQLHDFDLAYAYEGMARALALASQLDEARKYKTLARAAGEEIADAEDKKIFEGDFKISDWYGLK